MTRTAMGTVRQRQGAAPTSLRRMEKRLVGMIVLRAAVVAVAIVLAVADRLPWWFAAAAIARELIAGTFLVLRAVRRQQAPDTDPLALVGAVLLIVGMAAIGLVQGDGRLAVLGRVFGWPLAWWGLLLSWAIIVDRTIQLRRLLARDPDRDRR
jgi:cardiolipin synthase (CMP-forming)